MLTTIGPDLYFVNQSGELCNRVPGYSFVIMTSDSCEYCNQILPVFTKVSNEIQGCKFAVMKVGQEIISIAGRSKTPLKYVPYMILYANGRPIGQYEPDEANQSANIDKMKRFLVEVTTKQQKGGLKKEQQNEIPAYSIGIPANNKARVCYLGYDCAYKN